MKKSFCFIFYILSMSAIGATESVSDSAAQAVGRILLHQNMTTRYEDDRPGLYHDYLPKMIEDEYENNIATLPVSDRLSFIWGVISIAKLGADGTAILTELIGNCCANEFILSSDEYLNEADNKSYVDEVMVRKARYFIETVKYHQRVTSNRRIHKSIKKQVADKLSAPL